MSSKRFAASIIVPLLDQRDDWLEQSLRSALTQTVPCEVIVVHAPKTRESNLHLIARLRDQFDGLLRSARQPIPGFAAALNFGINLAGADRVGLLMSDDWLDREAVALCVKHENDIVSTGQTSYASDGVTSLPEVSAIPNLRGFERRKHLDQRASYLSHFFLFRRDRLKAIGGADETLGDFPGIDDFDMVWVLLERGASVGIVQQSLYNYRDHEGERLTLRDPADAIAGLERILRKHNVTEADRARIMAAHTPWYGEPVHRANQRRKSRAGAA
jgi:glycosyltransferase involved in cell wall biosynthesis